MPTITSFSLSNKTIEGVINQCYKNWELLITDDCSTDSTCEVILSFIKLDSRIKLFQLKNNSGAGAARNNSIYKAKGRYIAFCDSDDIWLPNKLDIQLNFMRNNGLKFTFSSYLLRDENGKYLGTINAPEKITYNDILKNNYIGCLTVIYDSKNIGKVFFPEIRKRQDWALWIKIIENLRLVKGLNTPLAIYTKRTNSISNNKFELLKYNWIVYYKELNFNMARSILYMIRFLYFYLRKKVNNQFNW